MAKPKNAVLTVNKMPDHMALSSLMLCDLALCRNVPGHMVGQHRRFQYRTFDDSLGKNG